jgi:NADPH-dependent ferric siderophore reductase
MTATINSPVLTRLRHETCRRRLTVVSADYVTPHILRLRLAGAELAGFISPDPGDHIKVFVPDGEGGTAIRDYTPRRFDPDEGWLEIDFALHDAGPATRWAIGAQPGDAAEIRGPRGSTVIGGAVDRWVLIGDETALPSIGRRIEEMAEGTKVTSLVAIPDQADQQLLATKADHDALWAVRSDPSDPAALLTMLEGVELSERVFVWIAAETAVARALRAAVLARGVEPAWIKAAGYWSGGNPDTSVKELEL